MTRLDHLMKAACALVIGATLAAPAPADPLAWIGTTNQARGIGELTDEQIVEALQEDGRVVMSGTFFEFDSANLNDNASEVLFKLASGMNNYPNIRLAVVGHTDSTGDFDYNIELSERRAQAVVDTLQTEPYNVARERLVAVGIGPLMPVASNTSEEGQALNRRVTFVLVN